MIAILVLMVAGLTGLTTPVVAGEEFIIELDSGIRLSSVIGGGPGQVDVAVNGGATIKFMWLKGGTGTDAGDVRRTEPRGMLGNNFYSCFSDFPPRSWGAGLFAGAGPDSAFVVLDTANRVVVTTQ